jgi:hypothetical protein
LFNDSDDDEGEAIPSKPSIAEPIDEIAEEKAPEVITTKKASKGKVCRHIFEAILTL